MAISAGNGAVANSNNAAVASLATASFTATAGARTLVVVVLLDNTKSVSTMTTNGTGTYTLVAAFNVSATLRIELWQSTNESSGAGRIVTANFSAAVVSAIALQQYSGDIGVLAGNPTESAINYTLEGRFTLSYLGDFAVAFIGWNGGAGDTVTVFVGDGNLRRSSIGAAGGAGVAIMDSGASQGGFSYVMQSRVSSSRQWGSIGAGIQASSTVVSPIIYDGRKPVGGVPLVKDVICVSGKMPSGGGGGILPPAGDGQIFPPAVFS